MQPVVESTRFSLNGVSMAACVGEPQHRPGLLDVVGDADPRLSLPLNRQTVVEVAANADVEEPVPDRDLVLCVERKLLHIRLAMPGVDTAPARQIIRQQNGIEAALK